MELTIDAPEQTGQTVITFLIGVGFGFATLFPISFVVATGVLVGPQT